MRFLQWIVLFFVASFASIGARRLSDSSLEDALRAADAERNAALRRGDTAALARLYADDFVMVTSSGQLRNKHDQLRDIASGAVQHDGPAERILHLTLAHDVAVVHGESEAGTLLTQGNADMHARRYTRVYVRRGGRWQLLATHISIVADSVHR